MRNNSGCSSTYIEENELKDNPDNFNTPVNRLHKKRLCLKCGKKFLSQGHHNRICVKCELINNRVRAGTYPVSLRFEEITNYAE
jgi:hypothetical protein